MASRMRDNVERWLIHEGLSFEDKKIQKIHLKF